MHCFLLFSAAIFTELGEAGAGVMRLWLERGKWGRAVGPPGGGPLDRVHVGTIRPGAGKKLHGGDGPGGDEQLTLF